MVSLCSTGRVASIEVHIDILRPPSDPKLTRPEVTWGQNLTDLSGLANACFAASWQKKHIEVQNISPAFFVQKLSTKTILLFEVVDLTSKVNSRPKVFQMYTIGFVPSRASRSFFPQSSGSIRNPTVGIPTDPAPPPPGALDAGKSRSRGRFKFHVHGYSFAFSCRKLTQPRKSFGRQREMIEQSYPPLPNTKMLNGAQDEYFTRLDVEYKCWASVILSQSVNLWSNRDTLTFPHTIGPMNK